MFFLTKYSKTVKVILAMVKRGDNSNLIQLNPHGTQPTCCKYMEYGYECSQFRFTQNNEINRFQLEPLLC